MTQTEVEPHAPRTSPLRNGNRQGDFRCSSRCGAKTRQGTKCQCPAIRNRARCRMHGGKSTGPKTASGRERSQHASWKDGYYSSESKAVRRENRELLKQLKAFVGEI